MFVCSAQREWALSASGGVSSRTGSGLPLLPVLFSFVCVCVCVCVCARACVCVWPQERSQKNNQCRERKNKNEAAETEAKITRTERDKEGTMERTTEGQTQRQQKTN